MQDVPIAQVMTPAPATVEPGDSVATAERLMRERRCQHLPVVEGFRVVGMRERIARRDGIWRDTLLLERRL